MYSRRQWIAAATAAGTWSCRAVARPNILLVIADDWSWAHAGAYGDPHVATPNFDRVARAGILFHQSFTACPSCTPSRSAVLSGRPIWRQKEAGVLYGSMPTDLPLYTHLLEDAGYWVGCTGKGWVPGDWQALGLTRNPCGREYQQRRVPAPVPEGIDARDYAANFADFLAERPSGKPFCFWLGTTEPHRNYARGAGLRAGKRLEDVTVPPFLPDTEAVRSDILDYLMEVEWLDRQLGKALDVLDRTGEANNTLVVVTSDNGMPFPRAKVNLYDWGTRMPLAVRWPARVNGGQHRHDLVSHTDLAPSFLAAAGVPVPNGMDGKSLLDPFSGRDAVYTALERHTMCRPDGATYPMRAIRTSRHLYIRNFAPDRWPTGGDFVSSNKTTHGDIDAAPSREVVLADPASEFYQLCVGRRPPEELYDVVADPAQLRNLASDPGQEGVLLALRKRLTDHLRATSDPRIEGRDPWQGYVYHQTTGYGASFNRALPQEVRDAAAGRPRHKPE